MSKNRFIWTLENRRDLNRTFEQQRRLKIRLANDRARYMAETQIPQRVK